MWSFSGKNTSYTKLLSTSQSYYYKALDNWGKSRESTDENDWLKYYCPITIDLNKTDWNVMSKNTTDWNTTGPNTTAQMPLIKISLTFSLG